MKKMIVGWLDGNNIYEEETFLHCTSWQQTEDFIEIRFDDVVLLLKTDRVIVIREMEEK